ncbi:MAG: hypothetical protein R3B95_19910 [Nitrospirales bacterium]|nr:hypothetical protein [Nitrospirales bacterium]
MSTVLVILGIVVLGFVVNVALKQSYNFLFLLGGKPLWWVVTVAVVAIVVWAVAAVVGWGVNVPAWACTIAFFMNLPPAKKNLEAGAVAQTLVDDFYSEMGIKHGQFFYKLGLAVFAVACLASWIAFYGEVCSVDGECRSLSILDGVIPLA